MLVRDIKPRRRRSIDSRVLGGLETTFLRRRIRNETRLFGHRFGRFTDHLGDRDVEDTVLEWHGIGDGFRFQKVKKSVYERVEAENCSFFEQQTHTRR